MWHNLKKLLVSCGVLAALTICILLFVGAVKKNSFLRESTTQSGTEQENVLEIHSVEDYLEFSASVGSGNTFKNGYVKLCTDLDLSHCENLKPIGAAEKNVIFYGTFDGDGHKISGIHMEYPDASAGMFAYLGGIVKNLQMEDAYFWGNTSGAIAADSYDAGVVNCFIDAKVQGNVSGAIVGNLHGNIFNCIAAQEVFAGQVRSGGVENCYVKEAVDYAALNENMPFISGYYQDTDFYLWNENGTSVFQNQRADLLQSLTARIRIAGRELKLNAYYSCNDRSWCFALPAGYEDAKLTIEAATSHGGYEQFSRKQAEEVIIFTWDDRLYPIKFLPSGNLDTLYVSLEKQRTLKNVHANKLEEIPGVITVLDGSGHLNDYVLKGFYGHGNDSWDAEKKSYNVKFGEAEDFLGLGENEDFSLLACYRDVSLMCYVTTTELIKELGFPYAPDYRLVNLYVAGDYAGVYFLAEKVELDKNRIDITNVYEKTKTLNYDYMEQFEMEEWKDTKTPAAKYYYQVAKNPEDLTGGYLLEADIVDYGPDESRFVSERGIPMTMKRARYSSKEQVEYISAYWQEFENALFAEDGMNSLGKHYTEYIDTESFAMQWLLYELVQEGSMSSSIYFYKESDVTGDGLLHACFPWDMEHSYVLSEKNGQLWNITEKAETLYGYWKKFYEHEDFRVELRRVWEEKFLPAIHAMTVEEAIETVNGMKNLRWFEERIAALDKLENSRWRKMYPLNRCQMNREFLNIRKDVLSRLLYE